jgi:enoyl-[acyl-carrier protein] reductase I
MTSRKVALVMGVANNRSIAWSCVQSFLQKDWDVIFTYQDAKMASKMEKLMGQLPNNNFLVARPCNVKTDLPEFFAQQLPDVLKDRPLNAIVHSIAHAPNLHTPLLQTKLEDYLESHHISAYSLLEVARESQSLLSKTESSSITALSYLGAVRAISNYHVMGPAKASLEAVVRGLALEMGSLGTRVNAVSAGPLPTLAAKGGIANFSQMRDNVANRAPLGNVTPEQVASTVSFLATEGTGITGQTIYVDGGYSIVGGPCISNEEK